MLRFHEIGQWRDGQVSVRWTTSSRTTTPQVDDVRRELHEELRFVPGDIAEIVCTGIAEDVALRQPELIFAVRSTRDRADIESQLDQTEHHATWAIAAQPDAIAEALRHEPAL